LAHRVNAEDLGSFFPCQTMMIKTMGKMRFFPNQKKHDRLKYILGHQMFLLKEK